MKYAIAYLIKGEAGRYNQKLIRDVGPKFNETYMIENPMPSHVTLKYSFNATLKQLSELEKFLARFSKRFKQQKIIINGFGHFRRFVAFLNVEFSEQAVEIHRELNKELSNLEWMGWNKFDNQYNQYHGTISYGNTRKSFDNVWNYIRRLKRCVFELRFDNIAILKEEKRGWKVHREFKIR